MSTLSLPDDANLAQLRKQARDLQRAIRAGDAGALAVVAEHHPDGVPAVPASWQLSAAQLVTARRYGFSSWPALVRHLDVIDTYRWVPENLSATARPDFEFLRRACLTYSEADGPLQRSAAEVLTAHPGLADGDIWVASACADAEQVGRLLRAEPTLATRPGGPHGWPPIAYLAYARHDPTLTRDAVVETGSLLLEAGADPDTGFLWHGMPSPFTLLTGAFGEGEQGPVAQPPHPQQHALARLLLEAGADPNDSQALYNRMFSHADDHLELLFEFGLGQGDGGPWRRRLGHRMQSPAEMLRVQLAWAVTHGLTGRVALLADHGVDLEAPLTGYGVREADAYRAAVVSGQPEVAELLLARGVTAPALTRVEQVVAAVLTADRAAIDRLAAADPDAVGRARARRPGLVVWCAVRRNRDALRLAVDLGWDVSARARTDVPSDQEWETALHHTAGEGDLETAQLLLALGADTAVRDARFGGTPLDWARHVGRPELVALLEPVTPGPTG